MADSFSDILSNYKEMSVEELGGSLLERQAQQRRQAAKTAKKSERVQKGLAVLLATQGIFKNQFNKRQNELKELKTLDLLNSENTAKRLNSVSSFVSIIPENFEADKPLEERVNTFMNTPELYNQLKVNSKPLIDSYLQSVLGNNPDFEFTPEYDAIIRFGNKSLITNLLENNNYQKFIKELEEIEPDEMSREDLFKKYISIKPDRFTQQRSEYYKQIENELKNKSGFVEGLRGIVRKISKDKSDKGELDLYRNLTTADIEGNDLRDILDKLDIGGVLVPEINKAIAQTEMSPVKYRNIMTTQRGVALFKRLNEVDFVDLQNNIEERGIFKDKLVDTENLLNEIDIRRLDEAFKHIDKTPEMKTQVLTDAGALSLRFQDDPQFAIDIYKTITDDVNKIKEFKNKIQDTAFRNKYAIMMTVKMGLKGIGSVLADPIGRTPRYQGYDKNPMTLVLDDVFETDSNLNFKASTDYYFLDDDEKKIMVDKKIRSILKLNMSQEAKQKALDNFFANIDVPGFTNQFDYIQSLTK